MERLSRRRFLAASAAATGLAGCLAGDSSRDTPTAEPSLRLRTLDVAGSPGGRLPVRRPGTTVLLDFFATWCGPCKPQMAHLREVRETFPGIHMLSITWERDAEAVSSFWREYEGTWPVALDPELRTGERYGVDRLPTLLVLAPDGSEGWRHVGLADADAIAQQLGVVRA